MLITMGSITTATRLTRIIERNLGLPAEVIHTPASLNKGGCSYSVRFKDKNEMQVRRVIKEYNVPIRKIYSEQTVGGKRVYNAVS